jgi:hypothetical protein
MLNLEDGTDQELDNKPSDSMELQRLLNLCITPATQWTLPITVDLLTLELPQPIQDGGRCSECKVLS